MNLQELGAKLRQERERRGLTLDEVILKTKISRTNLEAIEAGRKEGLPHPVYAKGFVKNYARMLGLDPDEFGRALSMEYAVAEDDLGTPPTVEKSMAVPDRRSRNQARKARSRSLLLLLAAAVVVVGITVVILRTPGERAVEPPASAPVVQPEPEAASEPAVEPAAPEAEPSAPEALAPETAPEAASPPSAPESGRAEQPAAKPAPEPVPEPAAVQSPSLPSAVDYIHHLDITATDRCWVYALVDGQTEVDVTLLAGERKRLRFNESLSVKFGNAGGVQLEYDGRAVDNPAEIGQVRTFTFP